MKLDPFTQEVMHEAMISIVAEMRVTLLRTAFSSVIYEGQDFSCALADRQGRIVCQSREDFPGHVGPLNMQVPMAVEKYGGEIYPGDVIITNDPFAAGTHLNDVALFCPIFWRRKLVMFACSRAHWGDVGGMTPGSVSGQTTDIFQEGVRIPIMKLHDRGRPNQPLYDLLFSNMRQPRDRRGDLMSQLAAANCGGERVASLVERYGMKRIDDCIELILDRSERRMRQQIARLPKGTYFFKDYMDSDGNTDTPVPICVKVEVKGRSIEVDFTGSAPQRPGPANASLAVTSTAVFVALKALLDPEGHINAGAFRPFKIIVPPNSLLNARYPAPMGGFVEVLRRAESALMGAMSRCVPDLVAGDTKGTGQHLNISQLTGNNVDSILYEYPAGGSGAFQGGDGSNTVREWDAGDFSSIHSTEIVELEHACLVEECTLRIDSGGAGKWRGGLGLRRVIRILGESGYFSVLSDRNVIPPFGVNKGRPGHPNSFHVVRGGKYVSISPLPGKVSGFPLQRDDRVVSQSSGGGGFGDPRQRDVDAVERDLAAGYISEAEAARIYRNPEGALNGRPLHEPQRFAEASASPAVGRCTIVAGESPLGLERVVMSAETARLLELEHRLMVELPGSRGAPLRCVVAVQDGLPPGVIGISTLAASIMQCTEGAPLEITPLAQVPPHTM